jgi:hypothetical protein
VGLVREKTGVDLIEHTRGGVQLEWDAPDREAGAESSRFSRSQAGTTSSSVLSHVRVIVLSEE